MNQRTQRNRSRRRSGKAAALLVSLLLLLTVTVGGTLAFLTTGAGPIANLFTHSQVTTKVDETVSGSTKSDVTIQNTGNTAAWIRAAVVITWQDAQGNVYGQLPEEGTGKDYTITWGTDWKTGNDGFYYWPSPVAAGSETGELIESCTALQSKTVGTGTDAVTYYLTVEVIGSGLQSKPANVFDTEWKSSGLTVQKTASADPMTWTLQ